MEDGEEELVGLTYDGGISPFALVTGFAAVAAGVAAGGIEVGLVLALCAVVIAGVRSRWEVDGASKEIRRCTSLFGYTLYQDHLAFEGIQKVLVEPAGQGMIRYNSNQKGGFKMVSVMYKGVRRPLPHGSSGSDTEELIAYLRKILPSHVQIERRAWYVTGKD